MSKIDEMLYIDEGYRERPYFDHLGNPTAGIGQLLGPKGTPLSNYSFTVPLDVAKLWCKRTVETYGSKLAKNAYGAAALAQCNDARRDALLNMCYQMGVGQYKVNGVLGFANMLDAVAHQDWQGAYNHGKDSRWYRQTPERCERVLQTLLCGNYSAYGL